MSKYVNIYLIYVLSVIRRERIRHRLFINSPLDFIMLLTLKNEKYIFGGYYTLRETVRQKNVSVY